jgi:hypothetical protein
MTAARQQRKERRAPIAVFALVLSLLAGMSLGVAAGGITERIVVDRHTGLAIDGYDPVAFYTDGRPLPGSLDFELQYGGAVWRFCNFGNRAAFAERPDVYMPKFGGYQWRAALPVLRQPSARDVRRRPGALHQRRGAKMAGGAADA